MRIATQGPEGDTGGTGACGVQGDTRFGQCTLEPDADAATRVGSIAPSE